MRMLFSLIQCNCVRSVTLKITKNKLWRVAGDDDVLNMLPDLLATHPTPLPTQDASAVRSTCQNCNEKLAFLLFFPSFERPSLPTWSRSRLISY